MHQATMYVIASCEDPPAGCRPDIPPEKLQGKAYAEVELRTLIACGTRAELQAYFHRAQDMLDRRLNAMIAAPRAPNTAQDMLDRMDASNARSETNMKLDDIASGLRALGR